MDNFNINRISTNVGIFRVSGSWRHEDLSASLINIDSIEIMGTDGWVLLKQSNDKVLKLVKELTPIFIIHLQGKH